MRSSDFHLHEMNRPIAIAVVESLWFWIRESGKLTFIVKYETNLYIVDTLSIASESARQ